MNKEDVRTLVKEQKRKMNKEGITSYSSAISEEFFKQPFYKDASVLYAYLSYNQEIETKFIIERAWADGKTVAVPKVLSDGVMEFYEIKSFDEIELGYQGIPEPKGDGPVAAYKNVLILMPGLAFDKTGGRIGYGGGFYDRYIDRFEKRGTTFTKVALAYDFQIFVDLPIDEFDKKVDIILYK